MTGVSRFAALKKSPALGASSHQKESARDLSPQRAAVNAAPSRILAPAGLDFAPWNIPVGPPSGPAGGSSQGAGQNAGRIPLQCKLKIGSASDPLEAEADAMAERVLRGHQAPAASADSSGALRRQCACEGSGTPCAECEKEKTIQRRASGAAAPVDAPSIVHRVVQSPGSPLDGRVRREMEHSFDFDFSRVRVHTGREASESARAIGAHAYTSGQHIVFGDGQYEASHTEGRRLIAHELAHVVQQSGTSDSGLTVRRKSIKVAGCGLLNLAASITDIGSAAHVQIQEYLALKGATAEDPIPRATKLEPGLGCRKLGTPWGYADLSRPGATGREYAEIKPVTMAGRARAKLEVSHYVRRAKQSVQRLYKVPGTCSRRPAGPDDVAFADANQLSALSNFSRISGLLAGDVTIGPFEGDPSLTLKAKEVGAGAICYWCTKDAFEESKKPQPKGASVGVGISIGGSAGGAYNAGVGISIDSNSTAYGTAGAGVSYQSDTKAAGAAGAGATVDSDSVAAGAAGAGATKDSQSIGAGVAGAGTSDGSMSAAAGAAAAGSSKDSATAGAGVAGKGSVKDSAVAAAGSSGSGHVEGVTGAGTGSPGKPVNVKDQDGSGKAGAQPPAGAPGSGQTQAQPGKAGEGSASAAHDGTGSGSGSGAGAHAADAAGAGSGSGSPPGPSGQETGAAKGAQTAQEAGPDPGTGTGSAGSQAGKDAAGGTGTGSGGGKVVGGLGVGPVASPAASDAERQKAAEEASKVAVILANASKAQIELFRQLAQSSPDGRYMVPSSKWVDTMMKATEGLSEDDIKYLQSLNWTPANITPEELRKKIDELLKTKRPPATGDTAKNSSDTSGEKAAEKGAGQGDQGKGQSGSGTGAKGAQSEGKGTSAKGTAPGASMSGLVQPTKYTGSIAKVNETGFEIQPDNTQITPKTAKGAVATLEIRWRENGAVKRARVGYTVVANPEPAIDPNTQRKMLRFDLQSTNDEPLLLSPPGTDPPTVLPAHAPGSYYVFTSKK